MKQLIKLSFLLTALCLSSVTFALDAASTGTQALSEQKLRSVLQPLVHAQANQGNSSSSNVSYRSKSEVMAEVKGRYGGQILRMSLNEQSASYNVRVLLPTGKVKNLQVSARK